MSRRRGGEGLPTGAAKRAQVRAMFDRIAPSYDRLNRVLTAGLDRRWRALALRAAAPARGELVVDLACGTGDLAALAAARGARVLGVDLAAGMLRGARRRGLRAALVQGDAGALPLPDGAAGAVLCGFALRNFDDLDGALAEAARVLAPGGRLALLEVDRPERPLLRAAHGLYFDRVVPMVGGWLSDRAAYRYLPQSTAYLPPHAELRARLEAAGFRAVARRPLALGAAQLVTAERRGERAAGADASRPAPAACDEDAVVRAGEARPRDSAESAAPPAGGGAPRAAEAR